MTWMLLSVELQEISWLHCNLNKSVPHAVYTSPFCFILNSCLTHPWVNLEVIFLLSSHPNSQNTEIKVKFVWNFIWMFYSGPYWTHVLFTWTQTDGLKVYINGTFSIGDPTGNVSYNYGDPHADLVIGTGNRGRYGHYATGAFDEFVIWERALSPQDIQLYYKAAIGKLFYDSTLCDFIHFLRQRSLGVYVLFPSCQSLSGFYKWAIVGFWFLRLSSCACFLAYLGCLLFKWYICLDLFVWSTVDIKRHLSHT